MTQSDPLAQQTPTVRRMAERFRGFLPVVVDVETGGFDWTRHALLEIAAIPIELDANGAFVPGEVACVHLDPAPGMEIDPKSLEVTRIDIGHPFRMAKPEKEALDHIFAAVRAGGTPARMPARDPGRAQRAFRPELPQRRGRARRTQAQSVPSLQRVRHRVAGRRRLWTDGPRPRDAGRGPGVERRRSALGRLRRRTHCRAVLQDRQRVAAIDCGRGRDVSRDRAAPRPASLPQAISTSNRRDAPIGRSRTR